MPYVRSLRISILAVLAAGTALFSCSTSKNTAAVRAFHNLTSHYNIYFNGNESFKKGLDLAEENYQHDFTTILPVFFYEDESIQQSVNGQMQRAIDKATKVITFHSITAKPKVKRGNQSEKDKEFYDKNEYNKWVDDSYMLMGRAYMYQGEFFLASETFKHVIKTFPEEESHYWALTWLARAYSVTEQFDEAENILVGLKDIEEFPEEYIDDYYTTLADYHIRLEEHDKAAEFLEKALETRPSKERRIRYTYILAQLYKETENSEASIRNFRRVVRMNPPYVMSFNAKVNMAEAYQAGVSGSEEIKKLLTKMLKDSKNKEYLDQIYFALGNIAMEEGEREKALDYYHKSVNSSVQNNFQKGESCLTLAEIYYEEPKYTLAAAYYDTAVNLLDTDYPNFRKLEQRSNSLNRLARSIQTFELQDSLQRLAALPEDARLAIVDGIIEDVREKEAEERRKKQQALQDMAYNRSMQPSGSSFNSPGQSEGGKWYFYNMSLKSFGQPEFRMKWGDRKLEDNWRRSNKQSVTSLLESVSTETDTASGGNGQAILDNKTREYYLKDIPLSDSALEMSHQKLGLALVNMADIYQNELFDYEKAIEASLELVNRYDDLDISVQTYYRLHQLYALVKDRNRSLVYKNLLVAEHPDNHYTKLLTNPNYLEELEEEEKEADRYYEQVYNHYLADNFSRVIQMAESGMERFSEDKGVVMKLSFLAAMSYGGTLGKEKMKTELDTLIALYPGTEIAREAQDVVDFLYQEFPVIKEADQVKEAEEIYAYDSTAPHHFALALKKSQDLNQVNFNLINYNLDNFNTYDLSTEMKKIDSEYNLILVRGFADIEGVERYTNRIRADREEILGEIPQQDYTIGMISVGNYRVLLEQGEMIPYLLFFRNHYPQK